jgi:hypothetical protein
VVGGVAFGAGRVGRKPWDPVKVEPLPHIPGLPGVKVVPQPPSIDLTGEGEKRIVDAIEDLGHPQRDRRKAALKRTRQLGFQAIPVMLALLDPEQKTKPMLRIGILRALATMGPLDESGSYTLGFAAMQDPDAEVRREACRTIRRMNDLYAVNYLLSLTIHPHKRTQWFAARALREINEYQAFGALVAAIRPQSVSVIPTCNHNKFTDPETRHYDLPVGPMGLRIRKWLPVRDASGMAHDIERPQAEALKIIAGKNLGLLRMTWANWLREKFGTTSIAEREEARRTRSMMSRMVEH